MKQRNYAAEYSRRIARLEAQGFSRSQARGHPKTQTKTRDDGSTYRVHVERKVRTERIREKVEADRRQAFGSELPKRQRSEDNRTYAARLDGLRQAGTEYDWNDQESFMDEMRNEGLSEHEGFDIWFGY